MKSMSRLKSYCKEATMRIMNRLNGSRKAPMRACPGHVKIMYGHAEAVIKTKCRFVICKVQK